MKKPRDLYELYREYEFGIGNKKAAKMYNSMERGANKWMYSFRLNFWNLVNHLVKKGYSSNVAIELIYTTYGKQISTTEIIRCIREDKKNGRLHRVLL